MFCKELMNSCKMTADEFSAPVETLKKCHTYVIGYFQTPNGSVMVSYKDGLYYTSGSYEMECRPYGFSSLSRAYAYFEELFYK